MKPKIGIFTAYLTMPGGSSRKGCLMAQRLSQRYETWLISLDHPDRAELTRNFGVPLDGVHLLSLGKAQRKVGEEAAGASAAACSDVSCPCGSAGWQPSCAPTGDCRRLAWICSS